MIFMLFHCNNSWLQHLIAKYPPLCFYYLSHAAANMAMTVTIPECTCTKLITILYRIVDIVFIIFTCAKDAYNTSLIITLTQHNILYTCILNPNFFAWWKILCCFSSSYFCCKLLWVDVWSKLLFTGGIDISPTTLHFVQACKKLGVAKMIQYQWKNKAANGIMTYITTGWFWM